MFSASGMLATDLPIRTGYVISFRSIFLYLAHNFLTQHVDMFISLTILDIGTSFGSALVSWTRPALALHEPFVYLYGGIVGASVPFRLYFLCDVCADYSPM